AGYLPGRGADRGAVVAEVQRLGVFLLAVGDEMSAVMETRRTLARAVETGLGALVVHFMRVSSFFVGADRHARQQGQDSGQRRQAGQSSATAHEHPPRCKEKRDGSVFTSRSDLFH